MVSHAARQARGIHYEARGIFLSFVSLFFLLRPKWRRLAAVNKTRQPRVPHFPEKVTATAKKAQTRRQGGAEKKRVKRGLITHRLRRTKFECTFEQQKTDSRDAESIFGSSNSD